MKKLEHAIFWIAGAIFLCASLRAVCLQDEIEASAFFGLAAFSFFFPKLTEFKSFQGLGFNVENWEKTQQDANNLLDRLKTLVEVYTRELVEARVQKGRWADAPDWKGINELFTQLTSQHSALQQDLDFSDLKKSMDDWLLYDAVNNVLNAAQNATVTKSVALAQKKISERFPQPISDANGYGEAVQKWREIPARANLSEWRNSSDVAAAALDWISDVRKKLKTDFDIELEVDDKTVTDLEYLSSQHKARPLVYTDKLYDLATYPG
ncbi:hypothetical protein [Thalassovita sp.]|uniref:hypothetical protein n=1 Tax=Thalassovita sp. TaxID=1979401 RepID=UPI002AB31B0D|nr:hypothetical protein [Thalassovita sp.]